MKTRVFNLIILDESGSMESIKKEAINGVNETLQSIRSAQRKYEDQEHYVTFVSFNSDDVKTIRDCESALEVKDIEEKDYKPECCTPLYDAIGMSVTALRKKVAENENVLVTIITDGLENASKEYTNKAVKALVEELKEKGWTFAYIGANQDVYAVSRDLSIDNAMDYKADSDGMLQMNVQLRKSRDRYYCKLTKCTGAQAMKDFFKVDD